MKKSARGVELGPPGHGHLHRRRRLAARRALAAASRRAHQQPRVVGAHGLRPDQDRVARGAHGVDPVEVGVVGEQQARRRIADVAVDRHAAREQGVGAVTHPWLPPPHGHRDAGRRRFGPQRGSPPRNRCPREDDGARQAGDEHHDAVGDRRRDALAGPEPRGGERPAGRALAWPPAGDARQHHGRHRQEGERQQPRHRRGGSRRARRDQERGRVAEHDERGGKRNRRHRPAHPQDVAQIAADHAPGACRRRAAGTRPRPAREQDAGRRGDERDGHERHGRAHGGRQGDEHTDGEEGLHDLAAGAFPRHGPQRAADVAGVAPVGEAAVDVAEDPARERDVEEERAVVRRDRGGQRQVDAEPAGDDRPAPGAADGGHEADARRRRQIAGVNGANAGAKRPRAQAPDHDGEDRGGAHRLRPRPDGRPDPRHGSTSRSACPTVMPSRPARACASRRRA